MRGLHRDVAHVPCQALARAGATLPVMAAAMHMKHQESSVRSMMSFCVLHNGFRRR